MGNQAKQLSAKVNPHLPALYVTKMDDRSEWLLWDNTQEGGAAAASMRSADAQGGNVRDQQRFAASMVNLKGALERANFYDDLVVALREMVDRYGPDHRTQQSTPWDRARALLVSLGETS